MKSDIDFSLANFFFLRYIYNIIWIQCILLLRVLTNLVSLVSLSLEDYPWYCAYLPHILNSSEWSNANSFSIDSSYCGYIRVFWWVRLIGLKILKSAMFLAGCFGCYSILIGSSVIFSVFFLSFSFVLSLFFFFINYLLRFDSISITSSIAEFDSKLPSIILFFLWVIN
jgi:hypothetical protein